MRDCRSWMKDLLRPLFKSMKKMSKFSVWCRGLTSMGMGIRFVAKTWKTFAKDKSSWWRRTKKRSKEKSWDYFRFAKLTKSSKAETLYQLLTFIWIKGSSLVIILWKSLRENPILLLAWQRRRKTMSSAKFIWWKSTLFRNQCWLSVSERLIFWASKESRWWVPTLYQSHIKPPS